MESLYIVMPTYNEEANIRSVVAEWYPVLKFSSRESKLVVADGGSTDKTLQILYELRDLYPQLEVLSAPGTDHGTKVLMLYRYAIKHNASWIFQTDSDGQTLPSEFSQFWSIRAEYDALLGNRKERGDGKGRKLIENILRLYLWIFFGSLIPDANAPFRLMRSSIINKYLNLIPANFNLPNAILAECFSKFNDKVKYFDITFQPRQGGENYMNIRRIIKIGWISIGNFYKLRKSISKYEKSLE